MALDPTAAGGQPTLDPHPSLVLHEQVLDRISAMRPMQASVARLATAVADSESTIDEIEGIIRSDPSLAATLLREANSAASAPVSEITTIGAAVTRLGLARVLAVAVGSMVGPAVQQPLPVYQLAAGRLWEHSIISSYLAEAIYRMGTPAAGPETVTAALLHHVGLVVLNEFLDPGVFEAAQESNMGADGAERELIDVDHAEVGAALLETWGLPHSITDPVRYHHRPLECWTRAADVVCVASGLANEMIYGAEEPPWDTSVVDAALVRLDVTREAVTQATRSLLAQAGLTAGMTS